jgi:hypothetical protein
MLRVCNLVDEGCFRRVYGDLFVDADAALLVVVKLTVPRPSSRSISLGVAAARFCVRVRVHYGQPERP